MRFHRLLTAAAVAAGLIGPMLATGTAWAVVPATGCKITLSELEAFNVDDPDGKDELRIEVDGNLFPRQNKKYVVMTGGDKHGATIFENPTSSLPLDASDETKRSFSLREVKPPIVGVGVELGVFDVTPDMCAGLTIRQTRIVSKFIESNVETPAQYRMKLQLTGI